MSILRFLLRQCRAVLERDSPRTHITTFNAALPVLPFSVVSVIEETRCSLSSGEQVAAVRDAIIDGANMEGFIVNGYGDLHIWRVRTFDE